MVGLGRLELPTYGLGIRLKFPILFVFCAFSLVTALLFWACSGAELATHLATESMSGFLLIRLE
jgi:hypothetical protein